MLTVVCRINLAIIQIGANRANKSKGSWMKSGQLSLLQAVFHLMLFWTGLEYIHIYSCV